MTTTRDRLKEAFKALRKQGWTARMNFWCCQGCALADLGQRDPQPENYVFWHNQDEEGLRKKGECYLAWGGDGTALVNELRQHGLECLWNGSDEERILVRSAA